MDRHASDLDRRNRRTAWITTGVVAGMLGLSFAAVPLYDLFCRTTGFGGTPMQAMAAPATIGTKTYTVRFDAGIAAGLNWRFDAAQPTVGVKPGVVTTVYYTVQNLGTTETTGIASYNVLPEITGGYFSKLQCFCYTEQTLKPGETREEAVVFFVDPAIEADATMRHIDTITLSYTFHPAKQPAKPYAAGAATTQIR